MRTPGHPILTVNFFSSISFTLQKITSFKLSPDNVLVTCWWPARCYDVAYVAVDRPHHFPACRSSEPVGRFFFCCRTGSLGSAWAASGKFVQSGASPFQRWGSVEGVPNYDSILKLAAVMPPLPVTIGEPSVGEIKSDIIPPASNNDADTENSSGRLNARQDVLRVLVVGDSMTHCNEGDSTWRYCISDFR